MIEFNKAQSLEGGRDSLFLISQVPFHFDFPLATYNFWGKMPSHWLYLGKIFQEIRVPSFPDYCKTNSVLAFLWKNLGSLLKNTLLSMCPQGTTPKSTIILQKHFFFFVKTRWLSDKMPPWTEPAISLGRKSTRT